MIETRLLHYFLAVAREENITRAAESLYISQSTLSKQMMDLEQQVGKQLFVRGKRKITLTEEGMYLKSRAQEILSLLEQTETVLSDQSKALVGDIRIGCAETVQVSELAGIMKSFHDANPAVTFHIESAAADITTERLNQGLLDMGLMIGPERNEKFTYLDLHRKDIFGLILPKESSLTKQTAVNIEQLKEVPLIISRRLMDGHHDMEWFGIRPELLHVVATCNLINNATYLVEQGMGYALCLENLVNTEGKDYVFRRIEPELVIESFIVFKKNTVLSPCAKAFLSVLEQHYKAEQSD